MKGYKARRMVWLVLAPVLITGCEGMQDYFGTTPPPQGYEAAGYEHPRANITTYHDNAPVAVKKNQAPETKMVEPGHSTVVMPKPDVSKSTKTTQDGPAVPNMAPTVGQ